MTEPTAIVKHQPIAMNDQGVQLRSMEDLFRFSTAVARSGMAPRSMDTPEKIMVAVQVGMEVGLSPMKALQSVVVINGLPSWKGDAALGLVRASGQLESFREGIDGEGDARVAWVESKRKGMQASPRTTFSVKDAKAAGLWGKAGPWSQYPQRMLRYRALGFHLRDNYSDVLCGMTTEHEAQDYPATAVVDAPGTPRLLPPPVDPLLAETNTGKPQEPATKPADPQDEPGSREADDEPAGQPAAKGNVFDDIPGE